MMRLFLTSAGLVPKTRDAFLDLLGKDPAGMSMAFIPTAAYPEVDKRFVDLAKKEVTDIGMRVSEVDLKEETPDTLSEKLAPHEIIYINGGNTFYLLDRVRKSGADRIIPELVQSGKVYVGTSAGSILASPTIEAAGWGDADTDVVGLTDLTALGLVDFHIVPHYKPAEDSWLKDKPLPTKAPIVALTDRQAIAVRDGNARIVGEGEKATFNGFSEAGN